MDIQKFVCNPPSTDQEADVLFLTLKQIDERKKALADATAQLKLIETSVNDMLMDYYKKQLEIDENYKPELEHGNMTKRKSSTWVYDNESQIIAQMKVLNPSIVRVKEELDKVKFKKAFIVAGDGEVMTDEFEIIDGVRVVEEVSYSIKVTE